MAFIQRKLREISKKIDVILDLGRKSAKDKLTEGLTSLEHENYSDAYEAFCKGTVVENHQKSRIIKKPPKSTIFGIFNELLSIQSVNVARFARNIECDFL